ncbi:SPFH domain-containing protein [Sediminibacterium ginsengisoli]|uniref:Regulator of protease activity HflC, stomatin/prohibitin superfamily n=1 Tax=Sediminibacterium ginsengisoli TaxID=413434 RepID=A0A1T4K6I6_9BACT|nr:SPFH domain-containing protein [Sediminibacterium ginsengisoli]SJZ38031.1 Regulator of protease activity HflC, stomatin/prohibitin superfamily [Sediminibacterium ginsengisoli]
MEKIKKAISGFAALLAAVILFIGGILLCVQAGSKTEPDGLLIMLIILCFAGAIVLCKGLLVVQPNYSVVLTFFGKYVGTVKENGLLFVNPLFTKQKISLRSQSLESAKLKVNDKMGNPIEIAAVILWQIQDTYKVAFDGVNFASYMTNQSEAAIRHLASTCPYDSIEDEHAAITLRDGGDEVIAMLEAELNERMAKAGIVITEARISHLAYSPEIAGAMLQRQQATAIVAARSKIVEGAVGMVEMALELLSKKQIVELDEEKKAAMVSNLMVVLCGERGATPVLNTGTLHQ